ncbi:SDR family oxidoreductase [Actinoplanes sp. CA-054009]
MKILVTGATGTVGGHVARQLTGRGHEVVALVRDPARADLPAGVTLIEGDLTDPAAVRRALAGVDRAYLTMADDNGAVFAAEAGTSGVAHVVLLSSFTAVTELPSGAANFVTARHRAGERALTEAGVPSTFLRASGFDYNILLWIGDDGVVRAPNPDVPLPIVDPSDIAAAAVAQLTAGDPKPGPYLITGPARLSVRDQVDIINTILTRSYVLQEITEAEAGLPIPILETMGPAAAVLGPTADVETLTGRAPRPFAAWVTDNRAAFK